MCVVALSRVLSSRGVRWWVFVFNLRPGWGGLVRACMFCFICVPLLRALATNLRKKGGVDVEQEAEKAEPELQEPWE